MCIRITTPKNRQISGMAAPPRVPMAEGTKAGFSGYKNANDQEPRVAMESARPPRRGGGTCAGRDGPWSLARSATGPRRSGSSSRPQHERVPVRVGEHREGAPIGLGRLLLELDALGLELAEGRLHVVGDERDAGQGADAIPMLMRCEER